MQKILEQIAITSELMGHEISPTAAAVMASDLSEYPKDIVIEALSLVRKESKNRLSLSAVIEKVEELTPGGRPSSEEAWAMIPKDEYASVVITEEMGEALGISRGLIESGDFIAARMAFKEAYERIVRVNKANRIAVKWFPSLGYDKSGIEPALADAIRKNRLTVDHALTLIPYGNVNEFLKLAGVKNLAIEEKPNQEDVERLKKELSKLKFKDCEC